MERLSNWIPKEPVSRVPEVVKARSSYTSARYALRAADGTVRIFSRWRFGGSYESRWPKFWPDEVSDDFLERHGFPVVKR